MTRRRGRTPLRLLLVTGGGTIPAWLAKCVDDAEHAGAAKVVLVLRAGHAEGPRARPVSHRLRRLLFWLHRHMDRRLFRRSPDALAPVSLWSALPGRRVLDARHLRHAPWASTLHEERIDVVLDPLALLPDGCLADLPTYGVWTIAFGRSGDGRAQSTRGFWEVVEGQPLTETRLCLRGKRFTSTLSLYVSVAPSDRRSVSRSRNHIYWKTSAALPRTLRKLWEDPDVFLASLEAAAPFDIAPGPSPPPGNVEMLRAWTVLVRRYVSDKWTGTRYREQWALALQPGSRDQPAPWRKVIPPVDRDWADPFPVRVGNDYYIFHEELHLSRGRGSIVLTVVDDKGCTTGGPIPILEQDCHLSYPLVFQWDGDYFMMPETASRRRVELYRCVSFPSRWTLERVLLPGLTAYDPTPVFSFGRWWLFATVPAHGAGTTDELSLFHAESPLGPWTAHRNNPINSDVRSARPAGRVFEQHGQMFRPAQDCSKRYGYAVSINRILRLDPEAYEEVEVNKITPDWDRGGRGVHTFNVAGNMTVIDWLVKRRRARR